MELCIRESLPAKDQDFNVSWPHSQRDINPAVAADRESVASPFINKINEAARGQIIIGCTETQALTPFAIADMG